MSDTSDGVIIIFSSPSGAGKTTLVKLLEQQEDFSVSVSHTTRKPRENEVDGIDYHFVSNNKFEELIKDKKFYEYAKIFDNYYGTSKKSVNKLHEENYDVIFDIDWQGTKQLSRYKELNLIKIFVLPPDKKELKKRLVNRNQDNNQTVENRLKQYESDIKHWHDYDYVVINNDLESCFSQIEKIIESHKKEKMSFI